MTSAFSLLNSVAAHPVRPGDEHAVILLYQRQPEAVAAFRDIAARVVPGAPVVVDPNPAAYRETLAQRGYFSEYFDDPDEIVTYHTHSYADHNALMEGFPHATMSLVDEGTASYYPNLVGRHLDPARITGVYVHNYLDTFEAHETTGFAHLIRRIDPAHWLATLAAANPLESQKTGTLGYGGRPTVVLGEQYFYLKKGVDITVHDQASVYCEAISGVIEKGYAVLYRQHPREATELYDAVVQQLHPDLKRWLFREEATSQMLEFDLAAGRRPAAVIGVGSTTMLTAPQFFGVPSFRIDTDLPLRLAQATWAESAGLVNNWVRFHAACPPLAALPAVGETLSPAAAFADFRVQARERAVDVQAALLPDPELAPVYVEAVRSLARPEVTTATFDAFDTLVVRKGIDHADVLKLADKQASDAGLLPLGLRFSEIREKAPKRIRSGADADLASKPELTLDDIYTYLRRILDLNAATVDRLRAIEIACEAAHNDPRRLGQALFGIARFLGKRTIIISDTFFNEDEFAAIVLEKLVARPDGLYLSSTCQATKSDGSLFRRVLLEQDLVPSEVIHFGDNVHSDVAMPEKLRIKAVHLPDVHSTFMTYGALGPRLRTYRRDRAFSFVFSVVARKFFDMPRPVVFKGSLARLNPYYLGYAFLGPAYLHWVLWILRESAIRGFDKLLFLARDGALPLEIFRVVHPHWPNAPLAEYTFASRTMAIRYLTRYPAFAAFSEAIHGFSGVDNSADGVIASRFGESVLEQLRARYRDYGIFSGDDVLREQLEPFRALISDHAVALSESSGHDSDLVAAYWNEQVGEAAEVAVVDFGYSGSSQRAIMAATGRDVGGLYFVRKGLSTDYSDMLGVQTASFSENMEFFHSGGFLEFLTTPTHLRTVKAIAEEDGSFEPAFGPPVDPSPLLAAVQRGIVDFAKDYVRDYGAAIADITVSDRIATSALVEFLVRPLPGDLRLFDHLHHEDTVGADKGDPLEYWRAGRNYREKHPLPPKPAMAPLPRSFGGLVPLRDSGPDSTPLDTFTVSVQRLLTPRGRLRLEGEISAPGLSKRDIRMVLQLVSDTNDEVIAIDRVSVAASPGSSPSPDVLRFTAVVDVDWRARLEKAAAARLNYELRAVVLTLPDAESARVAVEPMFDRFEDVWLRVGTGIDAMAAPHRGAVQLRVRRGKSLIRSVARRVLRKGHH